MTTTDFGEAADGLIEGPAWSCERKLGTSSKVVHRPL
jgi:hypothetical protein